MQTITYEINGEKHTLNVPGSLSEMNGEQLVVATRRIISNDADLAIGDLVTLTGMPEDVLSALTGWQLYSIREMFDFIRESDRDSLRFKDWKIPSINVNGVEYYGPQSNFGNVSWEEFVYVDQCFINGYHKAMVAALFRPERAGFDGETDRRIPFTTYGTTHRFELFADLLPEVQTAIVLNYCAMRTASLADIYTEIFPEQKAGDENEDDDADFVEKEDNPGTPSQFSWTNVHRNLIGDNIQDEDKYLKLNVHTVLNRMNQLIIENRKRK